MLTLVDVIQSVEQLNKADERALLEYLQQRASVEPDDKPRAFVFDMHPNAMVMSDDFDAELPDEFWLGDA